MSFLFHLLGTLKQEREGKRGRERVGEREKGRERRGEIEWGERERREGERDGERVTLKKCREILSVKFP